MSHKGIPSVTILTLQQMMPDRNDQVRRGEESQHDFEVDPCEEALERWVHGNR